MHNPLKFVPAIAVNGSRSGDSTRTRSLIPRIGGVTGTRLVMLSVPAWFSGAVMCLIAAVFLSFSLDSSGAINGVFGGVMATFGALTALVGFMLCSLAWILLPAGLVMGMSKRLKRR